MGAKQKCPEFENHERWLVSFADMMTLLFALFVVLFALKKGADEEQIEQAAQALQETFNAPLDSIPIDRRVLPHETGIGIFDHLRGDSIKPSNMKKFPSSTDRIRVLDDEAKRLKLELEDRLYGPNKLPDPQKTGQERIVSVHRTADGLALRLVARHFYDPGSVTIKRSAFRELDELARILKELGRPITIEGHTDSLPSGTISNWDLSSMRATSVVKYLVRHHNFPTTTLSVAGYGDTRPVASNATESGRALNRRIEIKIDYDE